MALRRDWSDARQKVEDEGRCRLCSATGIKLDAAHLIGRRFDRPRVEGSSTRVLYVHPDSIVPLCANQVVETGGEARVRVGCHYQYDAGDVSLLSVVTLDEQLRAVQDAGGIELARLRLDRPAYRKGP